MKYIVTLKQTETRSFDSGKQYENVEEITLTFRDFENVQDFIQLVDDAEEDKNNISIKIKVILEG